MIAASNQREIRRGPFKGLARDGDAVKTRPALTVQRLKSLLRLEPESGQLYWLPRSPSDFFNSRPEREAKRWNGRHAGEKAFTAKDTHGYHHGSIDGRLYLAHIVIFTLAHGFWPEGQIDHINGDRTDNRPENLREVGLVENARNQRLQRSNSSGTSGVCWDRQHKKWLVQIGNGKRNVKVGRFKNLEQAVAARKKAERDLGYHENHGRRN